MNRITKLILLFSTSLFTFNSCQNNTTGELKEPAYHVDPSRSEPPYPVIALPPDADTTSPRWKGIDLSPKSPVVPVSPQEELKSFVLQPGYELTPVLTEPQIIEPAAIQFDGNGRMYVLELRTYMQDIDATDELMPVSRISRWEDTNQDGTYDKGVVFLDSLVFPRFVVPFGPNTILSMESNEDEVYKYTDTDGDGKADKKELFASGLGRSGNVEHQTSFLTWAMDNWMYSTYNAKRIRWTPEGVIQERSGHPHGQWGVTQDDYGLIWMQGGASGVPANFQFPIVYGNYDVKGQYEDGFRVPYSLVRLADFEPGMREVKPDGSLSNVTGAAGNDVFRGDRLPRELQGNYFYGEPVARIIRQVHSSKREGLTYIQNAHIENQSEFIQSTDPLFRPVDIATAPDGTMYIVDMYRGIIQEGTWTQDGSYLRTKIQQYQMDDIIRNGRIWRLTYDGMDRSKEQPRMFDEPSSTLVEHLSHPNGWWRDKAQQLLILRQDHSVVAQLEEMMLHDTNELARIHAIWTLEGLRALPLEQTVLLMQDASPMIRKQALRASESLYKYGQSSLENHYLKLLKDPDVNVVIQAMQTLSILDIDNTPNHVQEAMETRPEKGVQVVGDQLLKNHAENKKLKSSQFTKEELALYDAGKKIFDGFCATCHGKKGLGTPSGTGGQDIIAPAFSGSPNITGHPEYAAKVLLHGLTGAIDGREYESLMIAMDSNNDTYIASVISYIRNDFGNKASFVYPDYIAQVRAQTKNRKNPYPYAELIQEVPRPMSAQHIQRVTASSTALRGVGSTRDPRYAFSFKGWRTEQKQSPDSWYHITFPEPVRVAEIQFDSGKSEYPESFTILVSADGQHWETTAEDTGHPGTNTVAINSDSLVRHLKIKTNTNADTPWGMKNLIIYVREKSPV